MSKVVRRPVCRKALRLWIILMVAPLGVVSPAALARSPTAAILTLDPLAATVAVGDKATVDIVVRGVTDLYGIQLTLNFDPSKVEVLDADPATTGVQITRGTCPQPDFWVRNGADNVTGVVSYTVAALNPSPPCNGDGVVASIEFRGLDEGDSALHFSHWILADPDGEPIDSSAQDGTLSVQAKVRVFLPIVLRNW